VRKFKRYLDIIVRRLHGIDDSDTEWGTAMRVADAVYFMWADYTRLFCGFSPPVANESDRKPIKSYAVHQAFDLRTLRKLWRKIHDPPTQKSSFSGQVYDNNNNNNNNSLDDKNNNNYIIGTVEMIFNASIHHHNIINRCVVFHMQLALDLKMPVKHVRSAMLHNDTVFGQMVGALLATETSSYGVTKRLDYLLKTYASVVPQYMISRHCGQYEFVKILKTPGTCTTGKSISRHCCSKN